METESQLDTKLKYQITLQNFLTKLQARENEYNEKDREQFPYSNPATFFVMRGRKYDRIVRQSHGSRSAYAFIDKITGGIIKCASWKQPEPKKYERGNIFNDDCLTGTKRFGVVYLK